MTKSYMTIVLNNIPGFAIAALALLFFQERLSAQWVQLPVKDNHSSSAMCVSGGALIIATQDSNILRSTDQGMTWQRWSEGITDSLVSLTLYSEGDQVYLGSNRGGYRSTNAGKNWLPISAGPAGPQNVYAYYRYNGYLFMAGDSGAFRSSDNGESWTQINGGMPAKVTIYSLAADDQFIYAGTHRQGVYRSSDNGDHWDSSRTGIPTFARIQALWAGNGTVIAFHTSSQWYRSTDRGNTWVIRSPEIARYSQIGYCVFPYQNALFCGTENGVARSTDFGETWTPFHMDVEAIVVALVVDGGYMYACTSDRWIWRRPVSELLPPSSVPELMSSTLHLSIPIPNPAVSTALLSYTVPVAGQVRLTLYDARMEEAHALVNEDQQPGSYSVSLDVRDLPSGVYYYRLNVSNMVMTQRLVVVK